jgi:hypothetical protein
MNVKDIIRLFRRYPATDLLSVAVHVAIEKMQSSQTVKVVCGEYQSREDLLRTYEGRLRRSQVRGVQILGLSETVDVFKRSKGNLCGGYAEIDDGFIYFWTDEEGNLAGCVLKPSE